MFGPLHPPNPLSAFPAHLTDADPESVSAHLAADCVDIQEGTTLHRVPNYNIENESKLHILADY